MEPAEIDLSCYHDLDYKQLETMKLLFLRVFGSGATEQERISARQLRILNDTETCYRFLYTNKFKYDKAIKMIHRTLQWRKTENVDSILKKPLLSEELKFIRETIPHNLHKTDRQGHPIVYIDSGHCDVVQLRQRMSDHNIMMAEIQMLEYLIKHELPKQTRLTGIPVNQVVLIFDLDGVSMSSMKKSGAAKLMKYLSKITNENYPEIIHAIYFIHVPSSWSVMWTMSKFFMNKRVKSKIHMIKTTEIYKLKAIIGEENLPRYIGGTCDCSHLHGCLTSRDFTDFEPLMNFDRYVRGTSDDMGSTTNSSPANTPLGRDINIYEVKNEEYGVNNEQNNKADIHHHD